MKAAIKSLAYFKNMGKPVNCRRRRVGVEEAIVRKQNWSSPVKRFTNVKKFSLLKKYTVFESENTLYNMYRQQDEKCNIMTEKIAYCTNKRLRICKIEKISQIGWKY